MKIVSVIEYNFFISEQQSFAIYTTLKRFFLMNQNYLCAISKTIYRLWFLYHMGPIQILRQPFFFSIAFFTLYYSHALYLFFYFLKLSSIWILESELV